MDRGAAVSAGVEGAVKGVLGAGMAVGLANKFHSGFRKRLGVSGKVALVTMSGFFLAALFSEQEIHRQQRQNWRDSVVGAQIARSDLLARTEKKRGNN